MLFCSYKRKIALRGILFFHSIDENRASSTLLRNLSTIQALCNSGTDIVKLHRFIFVTTMWDKVNERSGESREQEMKGGAWKGSIAAGCQVARFCGTRESAWEIVNKIITTLPPTSYRLQQPQLATVDQGISTIQLEESEAITRQTERRSHHRFLAIRDFFCIKLCPSVFSGSI